MTAAVAIEEGELADELAALLPDCTVTSIHSRPFAYRTSHRIYEVEVCFDDGACERLILKDLGPGSFSAAAADVRPAFVVEPIREIEMYRDVLAVAALGTAELRGAVVRPDTGRYWLFLERLEGVELYQVGSLEVWCVAASRLADLHRRLATARTPHLLRWDENYAAGWISRAAEVSGDRAVTMIARRSDELVERLLRGPCGLVHGELYASNVLVDVARGRVSPIDWETAGVGPQLLDLAALTSGAWTEAERLAMVLAYREAAGLAGDLEELLTQLDVCRLHVALQWVGWARGWTPPREQAHDWLADVELLGRRLGLL